MTGGTYTLVSWHEACQYISFVLLRGWCSYPVCMRCLLEGDGLLLTDGLLTTSANRQDANTSS